jgi:hypothetical protein
MGANTAGESGVRHRLPGDYLKFRVSANVVNTHPGTNRNGWDASIYALNVLNSHPLRHNTALETAQFVGPAYTIRPLSARLGAIHRW